MEKVQSGNTPNRDVSYCCVLSTRFVQIQVKTFKQKSRTCAVENLGNYLGHLYNSLIVLYLQTDFE